MTMGSTRFILTALLVCVLVAGVQSEALLRVLPPTQSLPTSPPTTPPPTTTKATPPPTTTTQSPPATTTTTPVNSTTTTSTTQALPSAPAPSLFALTSCDAGLLLLSVSGEGLGWVRILDANTSNPIVNLLDGQQSAPVPLNASSGIGYVRFQVPWQTYFTPYTAVLVSNATYGSVMVRSFNFTCRDGAVTNPPPTTKPPIVLVTTPAPAPADYIFGPLSSSCSSDGGGFLIRVTAQLVIRNIVLSPTTVVVKRTNGTVVWSSQIYSFDPMTLVLRVPLDFNLNSTYVVQIYSYAANDTNRQGILLYTYPTVQFCPPVTPPVVTFGPKTPAPFSIPTISVIDCTTRGVYTFQVYQTNGTAKYVKLSPQAGQKLWETNLIDGKDQLAIPSPTGAYLLRFQVPSSGAYYVVLLDAQQNVVRSLLAPSCSVSTTSPPDVTLAPVPIPTTFTMLNCSFNTALFLVEGRSGAMIKVKTQSPTPVWQINQRSGLDYARIFDLGTKRFVPWTLLPNMTSTPLTAVVYASARYGGGVTKQFNFTCSGN